MSNQVGRPAAPAPVDYTFAAAAALASQNPVAAPPASNAPPMSRDQQATASQGSAPAAMPLDGDDTIYMDQGGNQITREQFEEMEREARMERRVGNTIGGVTTIGFGVATGVSAIRALNTARTAATAASGVAKVASAGGMISRIAGKALPGLGIVTGVIGIGAGIANWNTEGNDRKADDVARMAGDALTIAGSAVMLTGVGAPIGLGLAAAGLIISGLGMIFDDQ